MCCSRSYDYLFGFLRDTWRMMPSYDSNTMPPESLLIQPVSGWEPEMCSELQLSKALDVLPVQGAEIVNLIFPKTFEVNCCRNFFGWNKSKKKQKVFERWKQLEKLENYFLAKLQFANNSLTPTANAKCFESNFLRSVCITETVSLPKTVSIITNSCGNHFSPKSTKAFSMSH